MDGQSVFVASGDQGSEGCNVNRETGAPTGSGPVAQAVDPSTGTLYVANKLRQLGHAWTARARLAIRMASRGGIAVPTASGPAAVALDATDKKVFVADAKANELTVFGTTSCNATSTSGCGATTRRSPTPGATSPVPRSLAVNGTHALRRQHLLRDGGRLQRGHECIRGERLAAEILPTFSHRRRSEVRDRLRGRQWQCPSRVLQRDDVQCLDHHGVRHDPDDDPRRNGSEELGRRPGGRQPLRGQRRERRRSHGDQLVETVGR